MWRNYVICVLVGLLLVSTGSNILLLRQVIALQGDGERLRGRLATAESTQNSLQQQIDQLKIAQSAGQPAQRPAATATLAPAPSSSGQDRAALQQIEDDV